MRVRSSVLTTLPSTISSTRIPGTTSPLSTITSRRSAPSRLDDDPPRLGGRVHRGDLDLVRADACHLELRCASTGPVDVAEVLVGGCWWIRRRRLDRIDGRRVHRRRRRRSEHAAGDAGDRRCRRPAGPRRGARWRSEPRGQAGPPAMCRRPYDAQTMAAVRSSRLLRNRCHGRMTLPGRSCVAMTGRHDRPAPPARRNPGHVPLRPPGHDVTQPLRVGIAGLGAAAGRLPAADGAMADRFQVAAICDLSPSLRATIGDRLGLPDDHRSPPRPTC